MSPPCSTRDLYAIFKDFGLPVAVLMWGVLAYVRQTRRRLSIRQVGTSVTDTIMHHRDGLTTFLVEVVITNDSPQATVVIAYYSLELPWNEPAFESLDDPADAYPPTDAYQVYGWPMQYPRDSVVNHRRYQYGKLAPGDAIRGFFFAKGTQSIPSDLQSVKNRNGRFIEVPFIVEDTTGKLYRSKKPMELRY